MKINISENSETLYSQLEKNSVSSSKQLAENQFVRFLNPKSSGKRIMFVGNSMTLHGKKADIGWNNEWGMAASSKENDYVHILMRKIDEIISDSKYCICQVAEWERDYKNGEEKHYLYESASNFDADIIVMRFIENCPKTDFDSTVFKNKLDLLLRFLNKSGNADIILTTGFWRHPADKAIMEYAEENGIPCVELGDLGEQDKMKAIGLFEHEGVANHPGDLGMKNMAERIFEEVKKFIAQ